MTTEEVHGPAEHPRQFVPHVDEVEQAINPPPENRPTDLRPSGYHFALLLPFSRHNSGQLDVTPGASRQVGNLLTPLE
jgi:hypothetical protein